MEAMRLPQGVLVVSCMTMLILSLQSCSGNPRVPSSSMINVGESRIQLPRNFQGLRILSEGSGRFMVLGVQYYYQRQDDVAPAVLTIAVSVSGANVQRTRIARGEFYSAVETADGIWVLSKDPSVNEFVLAQHGKNSDSWDRVGLPRNEWYQLFRVEESLGLMSGGIALRQSGNAWERIPQLDGVEVRDPAPLQLSDGAVVALRRTTHGPDMIIDEVVRVGPGNAGPSVLWRAVGTDHFWCFYHGASEGIVGIIDLNGNTLHILEFAAHGIETQPVRDVAVEIQGSPTVLDARAYNDKCLVATASAQPAPHSVLWVLDLSAGTVSKVWDVDEILGPGRFIDAGTFAAVGTHELIRLRISTPEAAQP